MPTPHKHAELIKKWADDPTISIEYYNPNDPEDGWKETTMPSWLPNFQYRIKPKLVKREGWMLVRGHYLSEAGGGVVYPNSFVYTDEREVPARTGSFKQFIKIKVEWEEEV